MDEFDFDSAFDSVIFCEDRIVQQAIEKGKKAAGGPQIEESLDLSSFHLAHHRAVTVGHNIGFYFGIVLYHLALHEKNPELYNEKVIKQLLKIKQLCKDFPKTNVEVDIEKLLTDIQLQYKKLCSLLKIDSLSSSSKSIDF